jgi:hypothetical protein
MGYTLSIVGSGLFTGISLTEGNLDENGKMFEWLRYHPIPNFCRITYILTDKCAWHECIANFEDADAEVIACLKCLYLNAIFFFIIGVYLEQVMPS